jgi:hypothetical protein
MKSFRSPKVVISGGGIAASVMALRLLHYGFSPTIITSNLPPLPGAELIPIRTVELFSRIGLDLALQCAEMREISEFRTTFASGSSFVKQGTFFSLDRLKLASTALAECVRKGVQVLHYAHIRGLQTSAKTASVRLFGEDHTFFSAVDATGRSAVWSHPIRRFGTTVATLFEVVPPASRMESQIFADGNGWSYRIDCPKSTFIGVLPIPRSSVKKLETNIALRHGVRVQNAKYLCRRAAYVQKTIAPIVGHRMAIGDAALAHNPISGRGISFAVASANAAAAVTNTFLVTPNNSDLAREYYRQFVEREADHHLQSLKAFQQPDASEANKSFNSMPEFDGSVEICDRSVPGRFPSQYGINPECYLRFSATIQTSGIQCADLIVPDEVVELRDGSLVKWLGSFDLSSLRQLRNRPVTIRDFGLMLSSRFPPRQVEALLAWCLRKGVLSVERNV